MKKIWCYVLLLGVYFIDVSLTKEINCSFDNSKEAVYLNNCNITIIEESTISSHQVKELNLQYNHITELQQNAFAGLPNLKELSLFKNDISHIDDGALNLPNLETLILEANELTALSDTVFNQLPNLKTIYLNRNKLEQIGKSFSPLQKIEQIYLHNNNIKDIYFLEFAKLPKLNELVLSHNNIDCTNQADVSDTLITIVDSNLRTLHLDNNKITDAECINKLKVFRKLKVLHIEENPIEVVNWNATVIHQMFPELKEIRLPGGQLKGEELLDLSFEFLAVHIQVSVGK